MGHTEVLESRTLLFDLSDFIDKWSRLSGRGRFFNGVREKWDEWKRYVRSNGAVGKLFELMKRYGIRDHRQLYNTVEMNSGEILGTVHGEYIKNFFDQQYKSPIQVRIEIDEEGEKWVPRDGLQLPLISNNISAEVLQLLPMEDEDERREWINKAISVAVTNQEWESLPFRQFYDDDIEKIDIESQRLSVDVRDGNIRNFDSIKKYLLNLWINRKAPKILK